MSSQSRHLISKESLLHLPASQIRRYIPSPRAKRIMCVHHGLSNRTKPRFKGYYPPTTAIVKRLAKPPSLRSLAPQQTLSFLRETLQADRISRLPLDRKSPLWVWLSEFNYSAVIPYFCSSPSTSHLSSGASAKGVSKLCQLTRRSKLGMRQAAVAARHCRFPSPPC